MKINFKKIFYTLLPLALSIIVGYITGPYDTYESLIKPKFSPPQIVFPIVWTILYLLMGYSSYLISVSKSEKKFECLYLYFLQLLLNLAWPIIFFKYQMYFFSFVWIIVIIILVINMIKCFFRVNTFAAKLNIPYLAWLIFATYLNFQIYLLN